MIRYDLQNLGVELRLDSDRANVPAALEISGADDRAAIVRNYLENEAYGHTGHLLSLEALAPIDLAAALTPRLLLWGVDLVEGAEALANYQSGIPDDSVS